VHGIALRENGVVEYYKRPADPLLRVKYERFFDES